MKYLLAFFVLVLGCGTGCGGVFESTAQPQPVEDTSSTPFDVDTEEATQQDASVGTPCEEACRMDQWTNCTAEIMAALPVGWNIHGDGCVERCDNLMDSWAKLNKTLDLKCLGATNNCNDVSACLDLER